MTKSEAFKYENLLKMQRAVANELSSQKLKGVTRGNIVYGLCCRDGIIRMEILEAIEIVLDSLFTDDVYHSEGYVFER